MTQTLKLTDILRKAHDDSGPSDISVGEVVQSLQYRGYGPLLIMAGLLTVLPTGAIPGVPTLSAVLILFISVQMLFGKQHPWLPGLLLERRIEKQKFDDIRKKSEKVTTRIDRIIKPRATFMFNAVSIRLIAVVCCLIALTMPPLEMVPFLAFVPAMAVTVLGLSLSARDGILTMIGLGIASAAVVTAWTNLT